MKQIEKNVIPSSVDGKYYLAVAESFPMSYCTWTDAKAAFGKNLDKNQSSICPARYFSDKFFKDPMKALLSVCMYSPKEWYDKKMLEYFYRTVIFNAKTNTYIFNRFSTIGTGLPPKDWHYEKFFNGEFRFNLDHIEVQLLSTNLETVDLKNAKFEKTSIKTWKDFERP